MANIRPLRKFSCDLKTRNHFACIEDRLQYRFGLQRHIACNAANAFTHVVPHRDTIYLCESVINKSEAKPLVKNRKSNARCDQAR